jgi:O-antigen/teichoic acid export membrane protein
MNTPGFIKARQEYVPSARSSSGLGARIVSGTFWAGAGTAAGAVVQLVSTIVFARLLTPTDFGLIAWADVFTQFILLFAAFGFNVSIVQQETLDRAELSTVWWSCQAIDSAAALLCVVVALITARTMASPDVPRIIMLMALQFVITSIGSVHESLMLRQFKYRAMSLNILSGTLCGFVVSLLLTAKLGMGVYGPVLGGIAGTTLMTINRLLIIPWLPSMVFSWERCKRQLAFGSALLGATLTGYANMNLDRATLGTLLDKLHLGYFEYAGSVPKQIVVQLGTLLNRAVFPALATLQGDLPEFRRVLLRYVRMTSLVVYPMLIGLALVADEFVSIAYGERWTPIVAPMRVICVAGLLSLVANSLVMVCNAVGRPQLFLKASAVVLPINAVLTFALVSWGGLLGAASSRALPPGVILVLLWLSLGTLIRLRVRDLLSALAPALTASAAMAAVLMSLDLIVTRPPISTVWLLGVEVLLGAVTYVAVVWIGWREEVEAVAGFVRGLMGRPAAAGTLPTSGA